MLPPSSSSSVTMSNLELNIRLTFNILTTLRNSIEYQLTPSHTHPHLRYKLFFPQTFQRKHIWSCCVTVLTQKSFSEPLFNFGL